MCICILYAHRVVLLAHTLAGWSGLLVGVGCAGSLQLQEDRDYYNYHDPRRLHLPVCGDDSKNPGAQLVTTTLPPLRTILHAILPISVIILPFSLFYSLSNITTIRLPLTCSGALY
jgi:hypothetical protein